MLRPLPHTHAAQQTNTHTRAHTCTRISTFAHMPGSGVCRALRVQAQVLAQPLLAAELLLDLHMCAYRPLLNHSQLLLDLHMCACRFLFDRSQLLLDLHDWEACLDDLADAMDLLPGCASLHYTCAMVLYAKGKMLQAQQVGCGCCCYAKGNMQHPQ